MKYAGGTHPRWRGLQNGSLTAHPISGATMDCRGGLCFVRSYRVRAQGRVSTSIVWLSGIPRPRDGVGTVRSDMVPVHGPKARDVARVEQRVFCTPVPVLDRIAVLRWPRGALHLRFR